MPHLTLEYSAHISQVVRAEAIFAELHRRLADVAHLDIANCKGRLVPHDETYIGRGEPHSAFVHLEIRLLAGRSPELKGEIGRACLDFLEAYFEPSAATLALQITVEIVDMERHAYLKAARNARNVSRPD